MTERFCVVVLENGGVREVAIVPESRIEEDNYEVISTHYSYSAATDKCEVYTGKNNINEVSGFVDYLDKCTKCGNRSMDTLVHMDEPEGEIKCIKCGNRYTPGETVNMSI